MNEAMSDAEFQLFQQLIHQTCGIHLTPNKKQLLVSRLHKRMDALRMKGFKEYREYVTEPSHGEEFSLMLNAVSTNKTDFFRESVHFDFLAQKVYPKIRNQSQIRIWCAASSSGEEPYTLAMTLAEALGSTSRDVKILATDISTKVLAEGEQGIYSEDTVSPVPQIYLKKYFLKGQGRWNGHYLVREELKELISFRRLNLMQPFPLKGLFDFIFCRNVMIYFDKPTREELVAKLANQLQPGGYLFIGNAESLSGLKTTLKYVQPAIYQRVH